MVQWCRPRCIGICNLSKRVTEVRNGFLRHIASTFSRGTDVDVSCWGGVARDAGLAITCQRRAPRLRSQRAYVPLPVRRQCLRSAANKAASWQASREQDSRMGDDSGLLCALLARWTWVVTGHGTHAQQRPWPSFDVASCDQDSGAKLVPAAGCRLPGRGRAELAVNDQPLKLET